MPADGLRDAIERMRRAGARERSIAAFEIRYERLVAGEQGLLPERDIRPLETVGAVDELADDIHDDADQHGCPLDDVAIIRLNGGLATTMAARGGKGLLEIKPGLSFVDLAVGHVQALRRLTSSRLPLLLMNSAVAGPATLAALAKRHDEPGAGPEVFRQDLMPRLREDDLRPIDWPRDPVLEWAPGGHGDVFPALAASGHLRDLLDAGFHFACISSIDNVAARVDGRIASLMRRQSTPFLMEVADRTPADRKGGHLAVRPDGTLVLRELAQTPAEDRPAFQDVARHRYFNTNTMWVDLRSLAALLAERDGFLDLPLIANRKPVDPYDWSSPEVIQLETAMGSAISVFPGAAAKRVGRKGFNPIKSTAELLAARSDAYVVTDEFRLELADARGGRAPVVELDPIYYGRERDFDQRFPQGPPSLIGCDRLVVRGDVLFGPQVVIQGTAVVEHHGPGQRRIAGRTRLGDV